MSEKRPSGRSRERGVEVEKDNGLEAALPWHWCSGTCTMAATAVTAESSCSRPPRLSSQRMFRVPQKRSQAYPVCLGSCKLLISYGKPRLRLFRLLLRLSTFFVFLFFLLSEQEWERERERSVEERLQIAS